MCRLTLGPALLVQLAVAVRAVQDRLRLAFGTALLDQLMSPFGPCRIGPSSSLTGWPAHQN